MLACVMPPADKFATRAFIFDNGSLTIFNFIICPFSATSYIALNLR